MALDTERVRRAGQRARTAAEEQAYHEAQAKMLAVKVQSICETWGLDPVTFQPKAEGLTASDDVCTIPDS